MARRRVAKLFAARPTLEGAGVHLKRAFGYNEVPLFDPFLMLDDFSSSRPEHYLPGFPWHPHRGIETVTYLHAGRVEHGDSLGNRGVIGPGEVQWMTAGSGIVHQEMPKETADRELAGFQLWVNLPAAQKMTAPRYRDVKAADIPVVELPGGATVRVVSGEAGGAVGPVQDIVLSPVFLDVGLPPRSRFARAVPAGHTAAAYSISGGACFGDSPGLPPGVPPGRDVGPGYAVLYEREGDEVVVETQDAPSRFLLLTGKPLGEPVAWRGPIVMNTYEELEVAFEEYQTGRFLKHGVR